MVSNHHVRFSGCLNWSPCMGKTKAPLAKSASYTSLSSRDSEPLVSREKPIKRSAPGIGNFEPAPPGFRYWDYISYKKDIRAYHQDDAQSEKSFDPEKLSKKPSFKRWVDNLKNLPRPRKFLEFFPHITRKKTLVVTAPIDNLSTVEKA
jgi:hypothetical protein